MTTQHVAPSGPFSVGSPSKLRFEISRSGAIRRIDCADILVSLFVGTEAEGTPANLYLRRLGESVEATALLGPLSPGRISFAGGRFSVQGEWRGIAFEVVLQLAGSEPVWFWHVRLENNSSGPVSVDLLYAQDISLASYGFVRLNEYYASQYIDHTPVTHPTSGYLVCSRQNLSMGGKHPWAAIGSLRRCVSFATDALQFYGIDHRGGAAPRALTQGLPGVRLQHEHALSALQTEPIEIAPGGSAHTAFFGLIRADHPAATAPSDCSVVERVRALPESSPPQQGNTVGIVPATTIFSSAPLFEAEDLSEAAVFEQFGRGAGEERSDDGKLLSYFVDPRTHVVLRAKELSVLRPHGHILRTGNSLTADESALTSTVWMGGVFHSMVTEGHVSINRYLSTVHSYLGLFRSHGMRIFVELDGQWQLLGIPSVFVMRPGSCRWLYRQGALAIEVESTAPAAAHELTLAVRVLGSAPVRLMVTQHVAINGDDGSGSLPLRVVSDGGGLSVSADPETDVGRRFPEGCFRVEWESGTPIEAEGGDELIGDSREGLGGQFVVIRTAPVDTFSLCLSGRLIAARQPLAAEHDEAYWRRMTGGVTLAAPEKCSHVSDIEALGEFLPWSVHNALIHYLSPRGLEQYSGGGWGSRDVTQGPVELLRGLHLTAPIRDILLRLFRQQNADGDWPQWFMFFDRERTIRPGDSHGDIVFWPLLVLAQYLIDTEESGILDEVVPFFHSDPEQAEQATVWDHVQRALEVIHGRVIAGTMLPAYGHGDWNDSMQPARKELRERLCSSWTATLSYQVFSALAAACRAVSRDRDAQRFEEWADGVRSGFHELLMVDDVVAGFAHFPESGGVEYLLHPRDRTSGISYSALPIVHAILADLFAPDEALRHLEVIESHLTGPDGIRLFDRPVTYRGGPEEFFQRAESSPFFGREIGLMYMHAHLRYAEALARMGQPERFFRALCLVNPIGIRCRVPNARPRQANCYYSSSDAAFADRYEAQEHYDRVAKGEIPLEGGWRVYSSGAGIFAGLFFRSFLGLRRTARSLVVDPMVPIPLDGLRVSLDTLGRPIEVVYQSRERGYDPSQVVLNGIDLPFSRESNPYRRGGAVIPWSEFERNLRDSNNLLLVSL